MFDPHLNYFYGKDLLSKGAYLLRAILYIVPLVLFEVISLGASIGILPINLLAIFFITPTFRLCRILLIKLIISFLYYTNSLPCVHNPQLCSSILKQLHYFVPYLF